MVLLILIALAQLATSVLILSQLARLTEDGSSTERVTAEQAIRRRQAQTLRDLMAAEAAATAQPPSGRRAEHAARARSTRPRSSS